MRTLLLTSSEEEGLMLMAHYQDIDKFFVAGERWTEGQRICKVYVTASFVRTAYSDHIINGARRVLALGKDTNKEIVLLMA